MINQTPLVMIPGPTPVAEEIREAMRTPTFGHNYRGFVATYQQCLAGLREIFQADKALVIGGAGTLSMEMALVNTVRRGEPVLVISHGVFGDRFAHLARALGLAVDVLTAPAGQRVPLPEIEAKLASKKYAALTLTHVDTSSGVLAQPAEVGQLAQRYGVLYILDGVCASAGIAEPMRDFGVDVLVTTSQKAFGTPPGLTIMGISQRAIARRDELGVICGYYADWHNWLPIMDNPGLYFSTPPVNLIVALNTAVQIILTEGLAHRYARHERIARSMRAGLAALGLSPITDAAALAPTLTVVAYPPGVDDAAFRAKVEECGVLVAGGVGDLKGKIFRIGHMGNINLPEVVITLTALEESLLALGREVVPGAGVGAAVRAWQE